MQEVILKKRFSDETKHKIKDAAKQALIIGIGVILSGVGFENQIYPFGIAFCGGATAQYLLTACLGVSLGAFVFTQSGVTLKYVGAVMLLFILKTLLGKKVNEGAKIWFYPAVTFLSLVISSLGVLLTQSPQTVDYILMFCDALISGAAADFAYRIFLSAESKKHFVGASGIDMASLVLGAALLLAGVSRFTVFGICPARIIGFYAVLLMCLYGKTGAGTIAGVCTGLVFGFGESMPHLVYALPLAGFLGEVCAENGAVTVALGFGASDALAMILKGNPDTAFASAVEGSTAALLFVLTPVALREKLMYPLSPFCRFDSFDVKAEYLGFKLKKRAKAMKEVSVTLGAVCRFASQKEKPTPAYIPEDVRDDVCIVCRQYEYCWKQYAEQTNECFKKVLNTTLKDACITPEKLPERLQKICREPKKLCDGFERYYCEYNARVAVSKDVKEAKMLAVSRYLSVSQILEESCQPSFLRETCDIGVTNAAQEIFDESGFEYTTLHAVVNENGRFLIEMLCTRIPRTVDYSLILQKLADKTDLLFCRPVQEKYGEEGFLLLFCEVTDLRADSYHLSLTSTGERFCGDTCESFSDGMGNFYCILSDGMGTGAGAALDSLMTCSLTARLLKAGFSVEATVETVNTALMIKSTQETLATLDILKINLYTGNAQLYKAGGSFSVLRKSNRTVIAQKASLPLGIIKQTDFQHTETVLKAGDAVILVSDGANVLAPAYFRDLFASHKNGNAEFYVKTILKEAKNASENTKADDITVFAVVLN